MIIDFESGKKKIVFRIFNATQTLKRGLNNDRTVQMMNSETISYKNGTRLVKDKNKEVKANFNWQMTDIPLLVVRLYE